MKVICTYSGIEFAVKEFSTGVNTQSTTPHPIFSWDVKQILNQAGRWTRNELSATERRLLFLATLKAVDLCEWKSPAMPTDETVQKNMSNLMRVLAWRQDYGNRIPLVSMTIRYPETHTLDNISEWIDLWEKRKKQYLTGYKTVIRQENLFKSEQILERLIKSSHRQTKDYAGQLATWFITAANVPQGLHEYWTQLFRLKGYDLYNARRVDLEELVAHAEEHLNHGSIYANATMKHLRLQLLKHIKGLRGELSGDFDVTKGAKFTFDDDAPEVTENMVANAQLAPETKPHQSEIGTKYPTKIDYLRALAYWGQKQTVNAAKQAAENAAQQKIKDQEDAILDQQIEEEYQHLDDEDDLQQELGLNNPNDLDKEGN